MDNDYLYKTPKELKQMQCSPIRSYQIPCEQHCNKTILTEKLQILSRYNLGKANGANPFPIEVMFVY
jgi:hypothetical protein